jgi:hypothetical protein
VFLKRLFQILPDIEVSGPAEFAQSNFVNTVTTLPVKFSATKGLVL